MIRCSAFILWCWWWVYYGAWNAGEWIIINPGWLTRHTFQMLLFVNAPALGCLLLGSDWDSPAVPNEHDPLVAISQMAQTMVRMTPVIFMADKIIIVALVLTWVAHLLFSLFVKE